MIADKQYLKQPKSFWAQIKLISMTLGYSKDDKIKLYTIEDIVACLKKHDLSTAHLIDSANKIKKEGQLLVSYFKFRSDVLQTVAKPNLMNREMAKKEFRKLYKTFKPKVLIPLNKQKGDKKHPAYLTGIVNILTEATLGNLNFDPDPRKLIVITQNQKAIHTLSRRVDGTYPSVNNPVALWEIKEYYGTTTFGSRVADAVYETMLDGYELEELRSKENIDIKHYLIVDDKFTWWDCGKSYLCRLVDMLHEGYLDEVIFGREVIERWPKIVKSWPKLSTKSTTVGREHLLQS